MLTSDNGWTAGPHIPLRPLAIAGVGFPPGIRDDDDVARVLGHVLTQFHARVEPLRSPGCWGYADRANRNNAGVLSNHASGTAVDVNAPAHPNGIAAVKNFTAAQIAEIHRILAEVGGAVRWGGDYHGTPDPMHFEINTDRAGLRAAADRLENDVTPEDIEKIADLVAVKILDKEKVDREDDVSIRQAINQIRNAVRG